MAELKTFIKKHQIAFYALVLSILLASFYFFLRQNAENNLKVRFEKDSSIRIEKIFNNLETGVKHVSMLKAFYESSQEVTPDEFKIYSHQLMNDNALDGLALALMSTNRELPIFVKNASRITGNNFTVKNLGQSILKSINGEDNCLILYVEPMERYARAVGLNLMSEKKRFEAIRESITTNKVVSTASITMDTPAGGKFFLFFIPVVKKNNGTHTQGVASTVFLADSLLSKSIEPTEPLNIHTEFYDVTDGTPELLSRWVPRIPDSAAGKSFISFLYPINTQRNVIKEIAGRKWLVRVKPGNVYLKNNYSLTYLLFIPFLAAGLIILFLYGRNLQKRTLSAEQSTMEKSISLAEKELEANMFFDTTIDLFCIADINGKFLKLNKEWETTLGYSLSELQNYDFIQFVHPDDKKKTLQAMKKLSQGKNVIDFTNRYMCKNGSYKYIQWRSVPHKNKYIYAAARDITDLTRIEKEVRDSEEMLKMVFRTIPDPTVINRVSDGKYIMVNDAYIKQSGFDRDEILTKTSKDINIWADYADRQKVVDALKKDKIVQNMEVKFRMKDGFINDCLVSGSLITLFGEPHILLTARVITDIKKSQQALLESEEKFRQVFMNSPDMLSISTMAEGRYVAVNDGFVKATGYTKQETEGKTSKEINIFLNYEDRKRATEIMATEGKVTNFETKIKAKDGTVLDCIFSASKITLNNEAHLVVTVRDISERIKSEQALKEKEFWLSESQSIGQIGSYELDIPNDRWSCTPTLDRIFGINSSFEKTIENWTILVHPQDRQAISDYFLNLIKSGKQFDKEYRIIRQNDNKTRWIYGRGAITYDKNGNALKMLGTIQDITERMEAEEAVRNSENKLRTLIAAAPMAVYMTDAAGKCTFTNSLWNKISGLTQEEALGDGWINGIYKGDRELVRESWSKMIQSKGSWGLEYRFCDKNGKITWVYGTVAPIYYNNTVITGYVGANLDITEQRLARQQITESEAKLSSLILNMTEGVALHEYILDKNGAPRDYRIIDVNPQYEKIIGVKKETIINKISTEAYKTQEPPYLDEFTKPFITGHGNFFETYFAPMDKHFLISVSPWGVNGFATIFSDISDRKRHDAERENNIKLLGDKNAEMERFIYTVSHDLKNPLITIVGFAGVLQRSMNDLHKTEIDKYLNLIIESAGSMNGLLNDLLEVSRVGRLVNLPEKILFADIIDSALKTVAGEIKSKNVAVTINDSINDITVNVDKKRLVEALQNLISNAIKFSAEKSVPEVEIGMKIEYNSLRNVFYVKDKGMGIEKQYLTKIFGLFDRLHPDIEGTGVGLAIVKRIIEVHEGVIWAESDGPGRGTAFYFTLGG